MKFLVTALEHRALDHKDDSISWSIAVTTYNDDSAYTTKCDYF